MRRLIVFAASAGIAVVLAIGTSTALTHALEAPEMARCGTGQPLFDHPVTEAYAKLVAQECREKLQRDNVVLRFKSTHNWLEAFVTDAVAFLVDPINIALTAFFGWLAWYAARRVLAAGYHPDPRPQADRDR
jgi:hypothetical protein